MYIVHPEFIFPLSGTLTLRGRLIRMQYHKKSSVFFNPFFNIIRAPQKVLAKFPPPPPKKKKKFQNRQFQTQKSSVIIPVNILTPEYSPGSTYSLETVNLYDALSC